MPTGKPRGPRARKLDTVAARQAIYDALQAGSNLATALERGERSISWHELERKKNPEYASRVDLLRGLNKVDRKNSDEPMPPFEDFRREFLFSETFTHQRHWIDLLEGRGITDLHPSCTYEPGQPARLLINTPPNHAKSMTITIDYATYRICRDPNVRIIIVSKTQEQAKKYLRAIKSRLSNPRYVVMQAKFGPEGGYQKTSESWTATQIYVGGEARDSGEKDPTVEALGIGGQIYGARADLIILDDVVTTANSHEWEKQLDWLRLEVQSRLGPGGKLLVVGTRIASLDLYKALRDPKNYSTGKVPWTYLAQPALLEPADDPKDWVTLWPKSDVAFEDTGDVADENGLFPRWNGPYLSNMRDSMDTRTWAMVYQQQDTSEEAVFHPILVRAAVNGMRKPGVLKEHTAGHPTGGGFGHRVICGLDPAAAGDAGWIALSIDPQTGKRYLLDAYRMQNPTAQKIFEQIVLYTERYDPSEWVIEKNGLNKYITQDSRIKDFLRSRGAQLKEHYTGKDKWDTDYGVSSLAPLFGEFDPDAHNNMKRALRGSNMIELPDDTTDGIKSLIEQLVTWAPETKNKTDMVMALWFVEVRAREYVKSKSASQQQMFLENPFATAGQLEQRRVVNLTDYIESRRQYGYIA